MPSAATPESRLFGVPLTGCMGAMQGSTYDLIKDVKLLDTSGWAAEGFGVAAGGLARGGSRRVLTHKMKLSL